MLNRLAAWPASGRHKRGALLTSAATGSSALRCLPAKLWNPSSFLTRS